MNEWKEVENEMNMYQEWILRVQLISQVTIYLPEYDVRDVGNERGVT